MDLGLKNRVALGLAKTLATQYAPSNILINNVCPGYTLTERVRELAKIVAGQKGISPKEVIRSWEAQIPMGRLGKPRELADLVVFLASGRAGYLTGATIQVDGGYYRGIMQRPPPGSCRYAWPDKGPGPRRPPGFRGKIRERGIRWPPPD